MGCSSGRVDGLGGAAGDRGSQAARSLGHMRAAWATRHRGGGYQVGGLWIGRAVGWMTGLGSGGVVVAVAVAACRAKRPSMTPSRRETRSVSACTSLRTSRHALGQRVQVLPQVGQLAADLGKVSPDFLAEVLHVGAGSERRQSGAAHRAER